MERWLSRNVCIDGRNVGLAIVTLDGEDIDVEPFAGECEAVAFTDCDIDIVTTTCPVKVTFNESLTVS